MNPFADMVRVACGSRPAVVAPPRADAGTYIAALFGELSNGPRTSRELATVIGKRTRAVHGLLGHHRTAGRVTFSDGVWALRDGWVPLSAKRAAHLLRSLGWYVEPPPGVYE